MTNQKLDIVVLIKENDKLTRHSTEDCTADNFLDKDRRIPYQKGETINLLTDNAGEVEVVIKDIKFWISDINNEFVLEIFV